MFYGMNLGLPFEIVVLLTKSQIVELVGLISGFPYKSTRLKTYPENCFAGFKVRVTSFPVCKDLPLMEHSLRIVRCFTDMQIY